MRVILEDRDRGFKLVEHYGWYYFGDGSEKNSIFYGSPKVLFKWGVSLDEPASDEVPPPIMDYIDSHFDAFLREHELHRLPDVEYWGTDRYPYLFPWIMSKESELPALGAYDDDYVAASLDEVVYELEFAQEQKHFCKAAAGYLVRKARELAKLADVPEVAAQKDFLDRISNAGFFLHATFADLEEVRTKLRELMKFVPFERGTYHDGDFWSGLVAEEGCPRSDEGEDAVRASLSLSDLPS